MSRVLIVVEGATERGIVENVFAPELAKKGVYLYPRVVGKPGHKGGNRFATVCKELKMLIHQEPRSIVTMLFDYYGLHDDWPGLTEAKGQSPIKVLSIIEPAITATIALEIGRNFNPKQFIPYIQLHEIESLLFAGPAEMASVFLRLELEKDFAQIVHDCGGCEWINDKPETAPSKRIERIFPAYKKGSSVNAHAYRIVQHIGMERIRQQCPHFNQWITKLEQLV